MKGYLHPSYAQSLLEFGEPVALSQSGGWLLRRPIPNSDLNDAIGCYPIFCCSNWSGLKEDLGQLGKSVVTVSVVVDPFASIEEASLKHCFHIVIPFKEHFVIDTSISTEDHVTKHHRYYTQKALKTVQVEVVSEPLVWLQDWTKLYRTLVSRHGLRGIKAFSEKSFATQFEVPGLIMLRAFYNGATIGAHLWFIQSDIAYSHLAAYSEEGYALGAAYALYWTAIQTFKEQQPKEVRWIDLGAGAGIGNNSNDGLSHFKRGWSTTIKTKYFCGRIANHDAYQHLCEEAGCTGPTYFPAYRLGEFS